jgi:hypothetical protein
MTAARDGLTLPLRRLLHTRDLLCPTRETWPAMGAWGPAARASAERPALAAILRGRVQRAAGDWVALFGDERCRVERPIDWLADICSGYRFEPGFHRRLDYRKATFAATSSVTWELQRLRSCVELAHGYAMLGKRRWLGERRRREWRRRSRAAARRDRAPQRW